MTVGPLLAFLSGLIGPAKASEPPARHHRALVEAARAIPPVAHLDGTLPAYVVRALAASPEVQAAHASWEAEVRHIAGAAALPEPQVSFTVYLRSIETRVGPQQARISLQQALPWPTTLTGRRKTALASARAAQARFDAVARTVMAETSRRYWELWRVRSVRDTHRSHLDLLEDLAATLRARVEVGGATFADLQQLDLSQARLEDALATMDADEVAAEAALRAVTASAAGDALDTNDPPPRLALPSDDGPTLLAKALAHPELDAARATVAEAEAAVQITKSRRFPSATAGADWIVTSPLTASDAADNGKDAVSVGLGLRLPLWQRIHGQEVLAARALVDHRNAETQTLERIVTARLDTAVARVSDSVRHVTVVQDTLLPLARATYRSVLGSYTVGQATVTQVLLAQRDLLEIEIEEEDARAAYAIAWANLDERCGGDVPRAPIERGTP